MALPDALNAIPGSAPSNAHAASQTPLPCPVHFVAQSALPTGHAYERHIFQTGTCPTREGLHDFFNGLCWHLLPQAKRRMNQLQAADIAERGVHAGRGAVRDALTLLDESGAFLDAPAPLWQALQAHDWQALFITHRALWQQAQFFIMGHALLEKLVSPIKGATAHVWCAPADTSTPAALDAWLLAELTPDKLARKPFTPLPVLGVPGWWAANEAAQFYSDAKVFRPPRQSGTG